MTVAAWVLLALGVWVLAAMARLHHLNRDHDVPAPPAVEADPGAVAWLDAALWLDRDLVADVVDAVAAEGLLAEGLLAEMWAGPPDTATTLPGVAAIAATGLTAEQAAGRFTENLGGMLVLPDSAPAEPFEDYLARTGQLSQAFPSPVLRVPADHVHQVRWLPG